MENGVQSGLQAARSTSEKGEKRVTALGSGALHFIRTRSSIRRELKRHSNQSKAAETYGANRSGGGGLGRWLREHLGGSRGSHDIGTPSVKRNGINHAGSEKSLPRLSYASQNLYCSLPREHGRHYQQGSQKMSQNYQTQVHNRPRSNSANFYEKPTTQSFSPPPPPPPPPPAFAALRRGGPVYSSEGKSMRRRNRDRRRHSLNEAQETGQEQHRKR